MKTFVSVVALLASAGLAHAAVISNSTVTQQFKGQATGGTDVGGGFGQRVGVPVSLAGQSSWDAVGDTNNAVLLVDIAAALGAPSGTPCVMAGLSWDVIIETTLAGPFGGSWLNEARIGFGTVALPNQISLTPGTGSNGGTQAFTGGPVLFSSIPLPDIALADGVLRIELFESFDDSNGEIDANYLGNSSLTIEASIVPAPAAAALLGMGGLLAARRRRA
jgi:hypothetical protein